MDPKYILRKEIRKIINEMSGFPRVKNMMMGNVDNVNTIGIITAENPMGQSAPKQTNLEQQANLKQRIRNLGLGFIQIKGVYGNTENPLVIPNITKKDLLRLGKEFDQESVISGEKEQDETKTYFRWDYVECENNHVVSSVYKNISGKDVESRENFYSAVKNRKFYFPFFDDVEADKVPSKEFSTVKQNNQPQTVLTNP
jgi:hypothetical protein